MSTQWRLDDDVQPHPAPPGAGPDENPRRALAKKLQVLRFLTRMSPEELAAAAGIPLARVLAAEGGGGVLELDDLERLAKALGDGFLLVRLRLT